MKWFFLHEIVLHTPTMTLGTVTRAGNGDTIAMQPRDRGARIITAQLHPDAHRKEYRRIGADRFGRSLWQGRFIGATKWLDVVNPGSRDALDALYPQWQDSHLWDGSPDNPHAPGGTAPAAEVRMFGMTPAQQAIFEYEKARDAEKRRRYVALMDALEDDWSARHWFKPMCYRALREAGLKGVLNEWHGSWDVVEAVAQARAAIEAYQRKGVA